MRKSGQIKKKIKMANYLFYTDFMALSLHMNSYMSVSTVEFLVLTEAEVRRLDPFPSVKAERTPRSERKRRDSFGMFDGYDSCSEDSTSTSSSEDSEDEVVPSIPASLPIIKNNGQVYTYPDGKAGMG